MKKILFFLLFSLVLTAQEVETINLNRNITDSRGSYKSFKVIDQRSNKEIGGITHDKNLVPIVFKNDATSDIKAWFYKKNELKGKDELVLLLENIKVSEKKGDKYSEGRLDFTASTFLKKQDGYHFIYRKDTVITTSSKNTPNMARNFSIRINEGLTDLLRSTYNFSEWNLAIPENDLNNYENIIKNNFELFKNNNLEEGVYKDFYSFFTQDPVPGFTLEINKRGVVTKAVNGKEKIPASEMYTYVLDGKAYKFTPIGFTEISKDEKGYFIFSSRANLFPATNGTSGAMIGGMTGGLVGALVGAAIDASTTKKNNENSKGEKVYLDPFTGNYIFSVN